MPNQLAAATERYEAAQEQALYLRLAASSTRSAKVRVARELREARQAIRQAHGLID